MINVAFYCPVKRQLVERDTLNLRWSDRMKLVMALVNKLTPSTIFVIWNDSQISVSELSFQFIDEATLNHIETLTGVKLG